MESITGLILSPGECSGAIRECSRLSAELLRTLIRDCALTYNQILYPYADALSLSGRPGTESTAIFGTHILLRGRSGEDISAKVERTFSEIACQCEGAAVRLTDFPLDQEAAAADDIKSFLACDYPCVTAGDFGQMLSGYLPHWRIRECARIFASFSEMSWRRSGGKIEGLCGGRLAVSGDCSCVVDLREIFRQKTGCTSPE